MKRVILHKSQIIRRVDRTVTTTLCGRLQSGGEDMNVADSAKEVTCKFCLKLMEASNGKD